MLQIGIMLHSLVIGLTLSVSEGSEFSAYPLSSPPSHALLYLTYPQRVASLVTAILFHQLFEGLSLGIRIAGLPSERLGKPAHGRKSSLRQTLMYNII